MDQGSTKKYSAVHNVAPTVTKFCVMWEGLSLPHDTKFGNCRGAIVDRRVIFIWSLIHGSSWSGLIKVGPGASEVILMDKGKICLNPITTNHNKTQIAGAHTACNILYTGRIDVLK